MTARFPRCAFGPFATRPALRGLLSDERVRTWWVGALRGSWSVRVLAGVMSVLPGAGGFASRRLIGLGAVLVIETDRRLLVLAGEAPSRVVLEQPWHRVEVEARGGHWGGGGRWEGGRRACVTHPGGVLRVRRVWVGRLTGAAPGGDSPHPQ